MKLRHLLMLLLVVVTCNSVTWAATDDTTVVPKGWTSVKFNPDVRYSQWVIESRLGDFYSNSTKRPFKLFDAEGKAVPGTAYDSNTRFDYVPGLVAKATIEARGLYQNHDWSKPWFYTVMNYGTEFTYTGKVSGLADDKLTLDDMNAAKMYFGVTNDALATQENKTLVTEQIDKIVEKMKVYNDSWAIGGKNSKNTLGDAVKGGWFHKPEYVDQMWGDGLYMGAALLAQIINYKGAAANVTENDWNLITKQFTISWNRMYNESNGLLYHAFTANPESAKAVGWELPDNTYHSAAHWGRACGWYFLALVDVLEQMQMANQTDTENYKTLQGYLQKLAAGLAKYQDEATGCWYQVVDEKDAPLSGNYLESSCTAIFSAAYLKGARLGVLDKTTYETIGEKAYEGCVNNFMMCDTEGKAQLIRCCASAGLGGKVQRSGSRDYYITGPDVMQRNTYTEGKVLGGFILAATEYERLHNKQNAPMLLMDLLPSYAVANGETASLEVKISGAESPSYQWRKGDWDNSEAIAGATTSTYNPTVSGKYFCEVTANIATPAKGMASARATTTIRSSVAEVTVAEEADGDEGTTTPGEDNVIATFVPTGSISGKTWTCNENNGFVITGTANITSKEDGIKFATSNTLSLTIPEDYTVTSITFVASNTSATQTDIIIDGIKQALEGEKQYQIQTLQYTFSPNVQGATTLIIDNSTKEANIKSIKVHGFISTTRAIFKYKGFALAFTETSENAESVYATTLEVDAAEAKGGIKLTVELPEGAKISGDGVGNNEIPLPLDGNFGEKKTFYYTVTLADGTTVKYRITVNVKKQRIVLKYEPEVLEWDKHTSPDKDINAALSEVTLRAYIANSDGTLVEKQLPVGIKYLSDMESVATVGDDGTISIVNNAQGGAKIYAYIEDSDANAMAYTFFNILITDGYTYKVDKDTLAPKLNEQRWLEDNDVKYVRMTFGGWKYNNGTYNPSSERTDSWGSPKRQDGLQTIDGFSYGFAGGQDACDEAMQKSEETIYGSQRIGWFKSPKVEKNETDENMPKVNILETYPFTLPVRGAYMTFEPQMNGTMSVYIIQNGAWNTDKSNQIIEGEFRPHAFHVVNQRGLPLRLFTNDFSVSSKQTVTTKYYCNPDGSLSDSKNVASWDEFKKYMSADEQKSVAKNWAVGDAKYQGIVELDNGSFLAIQKGIVKYTFHVTGHETYYFFSNFSKMGFCGVNFVPDSENEGKQPKDALVLSDTEKFPEITYKADGEITGNVGLRKFKFTVGSEEKGNVEGIQAPQFKTITVNRDFKKGQWTTLTLPFNMTQHKVEEVFGFGTELIMLDKSSIIDDVARLHFLYHEIQNVLPGYPYLIKPTLVDASGNALETKDGVRTINGETLIRFVVPVKHVSPFISQKEIDCGAYTAKGTPGYSTAGIADKPGYSVLYEAGDIFVSEGNGNLYVSQGSSYGKGYRSYLKKNPGTAHVKSVKLFYSGVDDNPNSTPTEIRIAELSPEAAMAVGLKGVYNLNGQKVAETAEGLPAGIYIVNGKKFTVK